MCEKTKAKRVKINKYIKSLPKSHTAIQWQSQDSHLSQPNGSRCNKTIVIISLLRGFPWWLSGKEPACQCWRWGLHPWVGKIPRRRKWQSTPGFLPGKSHAQRSLAGYSLWGCKRVRHDLAIKQQQHFSDEATHQERLQDFFQWSIT